MGIDRSQSRSRELIRDCLNHLNTPPVLPAMAATERRHLIARCEEYLAQSETAPTMDVVRRIDDFWKDWIKQYPNSAEHVTAFERNLVRMLTHE